MRDREVMTKDKKWKSKISLDKIRSGTEQQSGMQAMYLWDSKSCGEKSGVFPIENRKAGDSESTLTHSSANGSFLVCKEGPFCMKQQVMTNESNNTFTS